MIKTSKHITAFTNFAKRARLQAFLTEYRRYASKILDRLWDSEFVWDGRILDISKQKYDCPSFISTVELDIPTTLSGRAKKCCTTQVCGMIKAATELPRKRLYMLEKLTKAGKPAANLERAISRQKIVKPNIDSIKAELNSICTNFQENSDQHYNGFVELCSIGKEFGKIRIPIKHHRHSRRLCERGELLNSFLISSKSVDFRWDIPTVKKRDQGITVGADQGIRTLLTLSTNQTTAHADIHGHTTDSVLNALSRKRKGSRSFKRAQDHRKNHINMLINQLDFTGVKQVNLEKIVNINYRKRTSRKLSHWTNTLIRDKMSEVGEREGFSVKLQSSTYRSQRCSQCGLVRKANRKGKEYRCGGEDGCGFVIDADLNAARNHAMVLPDIPYALRKQGLNRMGFWWTPTGFKTLAGEELTVPLSEERP